MRDMSAMTQKREAYGDYGIRIVALGLALNGWSFNDLISYPGAWHSHPLEDMCQ